MVAFSKAVLHSQLFHVPSLSVVGVGPLSLAMLWAAEFGHVVGC